MMKKGPKVSVCMPNYNYGNYIGKSIQSVLDQTFKDFELIIVDDASTDNSISEIKKFSDNRIHFYQNEKNIGRLKNINKALSIAQGIYIILLPSDNLISPNILERSVSVLDLNKNVGLVHSSYEAIDINGSIIDRPHNDYSEHIEDGEIIFKKLIFNKYRICVSTALVRKECYDTLGLFNEAVTGGADRDMWMRICLGDYDIAYINEILGYERKHDRNITIFHLSTNLSGMNRYRVLKMTFLNLPEKKKHLSHLEDSAIKELAKNILFSAGKNLIDGDPKLARKNIGLAIAIDDGIVLDWRSWIFLIGTFAGCLIQKLPKNYDNPIFKKLKIIILK